MQKNLQIKIKAVSLQPVSNMKTERQNSRKYRQELRNGSTLK